MKDLNSATHPTLTPERTTPAVPADRALVLRVLEERALQPVFQPIFRSTGGEVIAFEGLIRGPSDTPLYNPLELFHAAYAADCLEEMELVAIDILCGEFAKRELPGKLFVNLSPITMLKLPRLKLGENVRHLRELLKVTPIVVELSEHFPVEDFTALKAAIAWLRANGFDIAVDDLGAGYAGLRVWSEVRPDYVKLDRHFVEGIDREPVKREFVRSICDISRGVGCKVIAEGIETIEEQETLIRIGCNYAQGYLLGRPEASPCRQSPLRLVSARSEHALPERLAPTERAGSLLAFSDAVHPAEPAEEVLERMSLSSAPIVLPVVADGILLGVVERDSLLKTFSRLYGRELFARRPIRDLMQAAAVIVNEDTSLVETSKRLTAASDNGLLQYFVIEKEGTYIGVGLTHFLLARITDMQLRIARYSNPLTMLPGNVPIDECIDELLRHGEEFRVAYCDIDLFKPYNDFYGYYRGDEVIRRVGELLSAVANPALDFVGHVGGDDFVLVFRSEDWRARCEQALKNFDLLRREWYDASELLRGGISTPDRAGEFRFFPLMSLSIGLVHPDPTACQSHHSVAGLATDAKREAKRIDGSELYVSRRRVPPIQKEPDSKSKTRR